MKQRQAQFLVLSTFIVAVSCQAIQEPQVYGNEVTLLEQSDGKPSSQFTYSVENSETKIPCTLANMTVTLNIEYNMKDGKIGSKELVVPADAKVTGTCAPVISEMSLVWGEKDAKQDQQNVVKFVLFNDHTSFSIFSVDVNVHFGPENFPNAADKRIIKRSRRDLGYFDASVKDGLSTCSKEVWIQGSGMKLTMTNVSLIAFNEDKDISSRKETKCEEKTTYRKVFNYVYEDDVSDYATLARMSISMEVPYTTTNGTIAKRTLQIPTNATVAGHYRLKGGQVNARISLKWTNLDKHYVSLYFYLHQDDNHDAYISGIDWSIVLHKDVLPNATKDVLLSGHMPFRLFSAPSGNGLYSCSSGTTLHLEDVRVKISDVLFVAFDTTRDFASKQVIDCNTQRRISESDFNYVVKKDEADVACIAANMTISVIVPYEVNSITNYTAISVPTNATAQGFCNPSTSKLELTWAETIKPQSPGVDKQLNSVTFYMSRNTVKDMYYISSVVADIYKDETNFPGADKPGQWYSSSNFSLRIFPSPAVNGFYNCSNVTELVRAEHMYITISNVTLMAFNEQEDLNTKLSYSCPGKGSDATTPKPNPEEEKYTYIVRDSENNIACTLANMDISMKIRYPVNDSVTKETVVTVPEKGVETTGTCDKTSPTMILKWTEVSETDPKDSNKEQNVIALTFGTKDSKFFLSSINTSIYTQGKNYPDAKDSRFEATKDKLELFFASMKGGLYKCDPESVVNADNFDVTFTKVALIAFNNGTSIAPRSEENCVAAAGADIGAIVGGIVGGLALIAIVVFGCMIWRKKRQS